MLPLLLLLSFAASVDDAAQPAAAPDAVPPAAAPVLPRLYVAPFNGADKATASLVGDRVLVAARDFKDGFDILGAADVQGIVETEATKAAMGCDTTSCANEIADALNADQIVTGQLGRIGDTWQLTLTRTERKTLRVLGRASRESHGDTPEGLLDLIPAQTAEVFGRAPPPTPSVLPIVGTGAVVVGGVVALVGVGLYADSWLEYDKASKALTPGAVDIDEATKHRDAGVAVLPWGYVLAGVGVAVVAVGAVLIVAGGGE